MSENEQSLVEGDLMEKIVNLSKRRGFVFQSADIYGGSRSTYDYGPIGVLLLRNVKDFWWRTMVQLRHDVVGIDAAIIGPPAVFEASGHLANFSDPLVECRECNERFRVDQLEDEAVCPSCGSQNSFTEAKEFNLMFKTHAGPVEGSGNEVFLRPETAQGMFTNFMNVQTTTRKKPPLRRATLSSARASSSRWRWNSSCRPKTPRSGTSTGAMSVTSGTSTWASPSPC